MRVFESCVGVKGAPSTMIGSKAHQDAIHELAVFKPSIHRSSDVRLGRYAERLLMTYMTRQGTTGLDVARPQNLWSFG